jgi:hypothetical protein
MPSRVDPTRTIVRYKPDRSQAIMPTILSLHDYFRDLMLKLTKKQCVKTSLIILLIHIGGRAHGSR